MCQRTLLKTHHFILAKLLKFQETFPEKFLVSGFGAEAPTDNEHKKTRVTPRFLYCRKMLELRSKPCFKRLFEKSPLKIPKNFYTETYHFILVKLLKFQETFPEKFLVSGFGAEAPTDNAHKKHGNAVLFYFFHNMLELRSKPPSLTFLIRKVSQRIFHRTHHFILAKFLSFQRTFFKKPFGQGLGQTPQLIIHT